MADPSLGNGVCVQVNVFVNGRPIPFNMKIGEAGEAFFVFETDEDVPADLITSPILEATNPSAPNDAQLEQQQHSGRFGVQRSDTSPGDADLKGITQEEERKFSGDVSSSYDILSCYWLYINYFVLADANSRARLSRSRRHPRPGHDCHCIRNIPARSLYRSTASRYSSSRA